MRFHKLPIGLLMTMSAPLPRYKIPNLCHPIDVAASRKTVKADQAGFVATVVTPPLITIYYLYMYLLGCGEASKATCW